jgi:hypothetical protein
MPKLNVFQRVVVTPTDKPQNPQIEEFPFEGTIMKVLPVRKGERHYLVKSDDPKESRWGSESKWPESCLARIDLSETQDPVRHNFQPDPHEIHIRRAIHILSDACNDLVLLRHDKTIGVYLVASVLGEEDETEKIEDEVEEGKTYTPRPHGTVQYQVSDGLPGSRSHSNDFYTLQEAMCHFNKIVEVGGFAEYFSTKK